jgi:hypothetical protein
MPQRDDNRDNKGQARQLLDDAQRRVTQLTAKLDKAKALARELPKQCGAGIASDEDQLIKAALIRLALEGKRCGFLKLKSRDLTGFCEHLLDPRRSTQDAYDWLRFRHGSDCVSRSAAYRFAICFNYVFDAEQRGGPLVSN